MSLIAVSTPTYYPTITDNELIEILQSVKFHILPSEGHLIGYTLLNYETLINEMDISENSRTTYKKNGKEFLDFIQRVGFTDSVYQNFKNYLISLKQKAETWQLNKLIVAKAILTALLKKKILIRDLTLGTKSIKGTPRHKDGLTETEVKAVLSHIEDIQDAKKKVRLKCMFSLLAFQGLRHSRFADFINGKGELS